MDRSAPVTMHGDEIRINEDDVRRLLAEQTPQWAGLPIRRLSSTGTDNAIFRLGDRLALRAPLRPSAAILLGKELDWLPHFAGLPLLTPALRHRGRAHFGFDLEFGVVDWIDGRIASPEAIADPRAAALALAGFLKALRDKDATGAPAAGAPNSRRGVALDALTADALRSIDLLTDEIDADRARDLWRDACSLAHDKPPVWLHGDLKADNLIARRGALRGVIDWGLAAVGDPAADYAAAWSWVDPAARPVFREALGLDDAHWLRAQGWALYGAVIALGYYRGGRNEALCRQSRLTLSRLGLLP